MTGALKDYPYGVASRFADDRKGTNPEEILGAAHAACFTMFFAVSCEKAGITVGSIDTTATVRLAKDGGSMAVPGTPRLVAQDLAALHAAVVAGLGIGALPEFMCRNGLAMKRLVRLLPEWQVADAVELTAVAPAARAQSPEVRSFVEFLAANIVPALAGAPEAPEGKGARKAGAA